MIIIYNMKKGGISNTRDRIKAEILDKQQRINVIDKEIAQIQQKAWIYLSSEDKESKRELERERITLQTKINMYLHLIVSFISWKQLIIQT